MSHPGHRGLKLAARPTGALCALALLSVRAPVDLCAVGLGGGVGFCSSCRPVRPHYRRGRTVMATIIDAEGGDVPTGLEKVARFGPTIWRRRHDTVAFVAHRC